jgi:hypothetical protein
MNPERHQALTAVLSTIGAVADDADPRPPQPHRAPATVRRLCVPGIDHSMNLEQPTLYAGYFGACFGVLEG